MPFQVRNKPYLERDFVHSRFENVHLFRETLRMNRLEYRFLL